MMMSISLSEWEWFGHAGHFFAGHDCRFHLCTQVGEYLVSTLGEWVSSSTSHGMERTKDEWQDLSRGRKYETMVFTAGKQCDVEDCNCGQPTLESTMELEMLPANNAGEARANHMTLCERYAAIEKPGEAENDETKAAMSALMAIRCTVQQSLTRRVAYYEGHPATEPSELAYRDGLRDAYEIVLKTIDEATEKPGAENA